jgi:adenosylhomocysteinase
MAASTAKKKKGAAQRSKLVPIPELRLEHAVKDISLAEWGRKEIELAEKEMPGLMAIRREHAA